MIELFLITYIAIVFGMPLIMLAVIGQLILDLFTLANKKA